LVDARADSQLHAGTNITTVGYEDAFFLGNVE
jgi:hypothetical protein